MIRVLDLAAFVLLCVPLAQATAATVDVPDWVLRGIIAIETSSHFSPDGRVVYVNKARGRAGERGISQAMPSTLREHGFSPSLFEQDTAYALDATRKILAKHYLRTGSWWNAVAAWRKAYDYHATVAQDYARMVKAAGEVSP